MTTFTKTFSVAALASSVVIGTLIAAQAFSQASVSRPRTLNPNAAAQGATMVDKSKIDKKAFTVPTPAELWDRIEKLEKSYAASTKAFETKIEKLRLDNEALNERVIKLESAVFRPGGQQGLKLKLLQKSFWNRIPNDAWLVYYQY